MTTQELIRLKDSIEAKLDIHDIDLNKELVAQFKLTRLLMEDFSDDEDTQLNHLTGLISASTMLLKQIADAQQKLFTATNVQTIERILAEVLLTLPKTQQEKFLDDYTTALELKQ